MIVFIQTLPFSYVSITYISHNLQNDGIQETLQTIWYLRLSIINILGFGESTDPENLQYSTEVMAKETTERQGMKLHCLLLHTSYDIDDSREILPPIWYLKG